MARPKVHGDRVEWKLRLTPDLAAKADELAKKNGMDRNAVVCLAIELAVAGALDSTRARLVGDSVVKTGAEFQSPRTQTERVSGDKNCPHKYRVRRGTASVCAACGHSR